MTRFLFILFMPGSVCRGMLFAFACAGLLFVSLTTSAQHGRSKPDPARQAAWLRMAADSLRSVQVSAWPSLRGQVQDRPEGQQISYRLAGKGCLKLGGGHFICFLSTSSDTDPAAGDLTLACDDRGRMALHRGHVCGGIVHYVGPAAQPLRRLSDFTRVFRCDTDTLRWEVYKP